MSDDIVVPFRYREAEQLSESETAHLIARMSELLASHDVAIHEVAHGSISLACGFNLTPHADGWDVDILTGAVPIPSHLLADEIEDVNVAESLSADEAVAYAIAELDPETRFIDVEGVVRARAPRLAFVKRVTFDSYTRSAGTTITVHVDGLRVRWNVNDVEVFELEAISGIAWGRDCSEQFQTIIVGQDALGLRVTGHGWQVQGVVSFGCGQRYVVVYQQGGELHPYIRPGIPLDQQQRFLADLLNVVAPSQSRLSLIQRNVAIRVAEQELDNARAAVAAATNGEARRRAQRQERQSFLRLTDLVDPPAARAEREIDFDAFFKVRPLI